MRLRLLDRIVILLVTLAVVLLNPLRVCAEEIREDVIVYYYADGVEDELTEKTIRLIGAFSPRERALTVFYALVVDTEIKFLPQGTRLLDADVNEESLLLVFSDELNEHGGTAYEYALLSQLAKNASALGFTHMSVFVGGELAKLPEGFISEKIDVNMFLSLN